MKARGEGRWEKDQKDRGEEGLKDSKHRA